jgi:hypothetical protein
LAISPFKKDTPPRQSINVGRVDVILTIAAKFRSKVIHRDEQDIHRRRSFQGILGIFSRPTTRREYQNP